METVMKGAERRRARRKKRQRDWKLLKRANESPSRNLGIQKKPTKKENNKKIKKITKQCLHSVIQGLYNRQILFDPNVGNYRARKNNLPEQTINLSDAEESVNSVNSSVVLVQTVEVQPKKEIVIDISKDLPGQNEVIDLTETNKAPPGFSNGTGSLEPTVIDITEEETADKPNDKTESDEISVIGTFRKSTAGNKWCRVQPSFIPLPSKRNNVNNLINCSEKLKKKYLKKRSVLDRLDFAQSGQCKRDFSNKNSKKLCKKEVTRVGENVYVDSLVTFPTSGLRPIIIDGSNVAHVHSNSNFSCKRLEICINYFKEKGHKVIAFVPQYRLQGGRSDDPDLLRKLEKQGDVVLTPSKKIDGFNIVPYDDRFIVQTAVLKGGVIISRDNYNDLLKENPEWAETIKYRTLAFTWVDDDVLMFPKDPLGEFGPSLEEFLRFH